jgi:RPA family protein
LAISLLKLVIYSFVAVVSKTSIYTTDDVNVLTSIRPEYIEEVNEATRDLWILDTAKQTLERIKEIEAERSEFKISERTLFY